MTTALMVGIILALLAACVIIITSSRNRNKAKKNKGAIEDRKKDA